VRRLLTAIVCAALLAAVPSAASADALGDAGIGDPVALVPQLFAALDPAADPPGRPCALMTSDLRYLLYLPQLLRRDPYDPATYAEERVAEGCDAVAPLLAWGTFDEGGTSELRSFTLTDARTVEVAGGAAHVEARLRRVHELRWQDVDELVDLFFVRAGGRWVLADGGALLSTSFVRPRSLAAFSLYRHALKEKARRARARDQRLVRAYARAAAPVGKRLRSCGGARSAVADRTGDVRWASGFSPVGGGRGREVDVRAAELRGGRRLLCLELRFAGRVPSEVGVELDLRQVRRSDDSRQSGFEVAIADGVAHGFHDVRREERPLRVTAAVSGRRLQLRVATPAVGGEVRFRRPVRWMVTVSGRNPQASPDSDLATWLDRVPDDQMVEPGNGVLHRF
jgi:hypothetical protein